MDLIGHIAASREIREACAALATGRRVHVRGSFGSSSSLVAGAIAREPGRGPVLLVVAHLDEADEAVDELTALGARAFRLPALEVLPGESSVSIELFAERLSAVRRAMALAAASEGGSTPEGNSAEVGAGGRVIIAAPISALMQPVPAASTLSGLARTLGVGDRVDLGELSAWLNKAGYERVETVDEPGQFSVRGDIVDVFPPAGDARRSEGTGGAGGIPVRLDIFGDRIDKLTEIDLDTMGSDRSITSVEIICADLERVLVTSQISSPGTESKARKTRSPRGLGGTASRSLSVDGREMDQPEAVSIDATGGAGAVSFLEYLPRSTTVLMHETLEITEQARGYYERLTDPRIYGPPAVFRLIEQRFAGGADKAGGGIVEMSQFALAQSGSDVAIELPVRALPELPNDAGAALALLGAMAGEVQDPPAGTKADDHLVHTTVALFCQNAGELSRLVELLDEHVPGARARVLAQIAYVHRGFVWSGDGRAGEGGLVVVPYHEMLRRFETRRRIGGATAARTSATAAFDPKLKSARAIDTFLDFSPGEYVVHRDHGIALFQGLTVMRPREIKLDKPVVLPSDRPGAKAKRERLRQAQGRGPGAGDGAAAPEADPDQGLEEYLTLEFAQGARLHVPATKIDQVQKYVGGFRGKPQLSSLGGQRWKKQKESVAESVRDLAGELLRVRAARESLPGVRYPADTPWQREFEAEFPFAETEDQLAALSEIKKDMMRDRPMDRLLCGDVGFGKTEVAIRAAFKAVEFGKQVAVLVPTTVLAEQHERTFRSRFADYPFKIASISRFKTNAEVNGVLADLRKGQVDVIIGTHRLLSKDVKFNDLGVVIIDEEQRFGVEHKERLLALRLTVDVLTLSATPIPRTLHMSMLGLRDISSLTTAPVDRRAVVTEVIPFNARRVQQAIQRELARDGQVFYVHNRVYDIISVADEIQKLAPDAKIVVGHGQMPDGELEDVMLKFMRRQADILVSTTIIESGIDIPTANTMFIDNADRFGLAELHQLRGRVGRYKHRAYCYMLLSPEKTVTEKALKRLKAIEEYSMLGAGFKIAMRDLEIRGSGNMLGPEQSGHIAAVGYEMYCQLLDKAVKELSNQPTAAMSETSVEIGVSGMIPKRYIPSDLRRMGAYRRIAVAQSIDEIAQIEAELMQAYGPALPVSTRRLLDLAHLRVLAAKLRVRSIAVRDRDVIFRAKHEEAAKVAELLGGAGDVTARGAAEPQVTLLPPPTGENLSVVYYRPPAAYFDPTTLLRVLRNRLTGPVTDQQADRLATSIGKA